MGMRKGGLLMEKHYNTAIIGAGTAGLTAALYAARSGLSVLVVENKMTGGRLSRRLKWRIIPELRKFQV